MWTLAVTAVLGIPGILALTVGTVGVLMPLPTYLFLLGYFVGAAAFALVPILFLVWCRSLFSGDPIVPRRSLWALAVLTVLSVWYFVIAWPYGLRHQGHAYTMFVLAANAAFLATIAALGVRARRQPSFAVSLAFHGLLFLWLAWYAFPSLGEVF